VFGIVSATRKHSQGMVLRPEGTRGFSPGFQPWEPAPRNDAPCKGARWNVKATQISCVLKTWLNPALVFVHIIFSTKNRSALLRSLQNDFSLRMVKNLKTSSSKILKSKVHDGFGWQNGYGAFSVSQSASKSVFSYIADLEIHHRRMSFERC
jgi:hypothetical protein